MELQDLRAELDHWCQDSRLLQETNLAARAEALDFLTFVDSAPVLLGDTSPALKALQVDAQQLATTLRAYNQTLFDHLRMAIQTRALICTSLRAYLNQFTTYGTPACDGVYTSYDGLDLLVDGLFGLEQAPAPTRTRQAEMVHCEETPARVILDLIDHVSWQATDVFYDLGSGLGQVVMLVHLLTGITAHGVEYEPAYVAHARAQAVCYNLTPVTFLNQDARDASYADGTIFFLFTPFRGALLQAVLARLFAVAQTHPIRVGTFGFCTPHVAEQPWLRPIYGDAAHEYQVVIFESI